MLLSCKVKTLCHTVLMLVLLITYCEFFHYYVVLVQCGWPFNKLALFMGPREGRLKVMVMADTHLLGSQEGHWFDKLRREWQMERSFQTTLAIHNPDVVFVLGDLFDEGQWCSDKEFDETVKRFHRMFRHPNSTKVHVLMGNHDIGFHYMINANRHERFARKMKLESVQSIRIAGNIFVLVNSMALEGDGCKFCSEAENALMTVRDELICAQRVSEGKVRDTTCDDMYIPYTRPILMQHFPMYRPSDANCTTPDADESMKKYHVNTQKLHVISKDASNQLLSWLRPRLILGAHTHHGCYRQHHDGTPEWTVASFNWRNKHNPTFLLMTVAPDDLDVTQCFLPDERTVIALYIVGVISIIFYFIILPKIMLFRNGPSKFH